jgi:O-antigen/teichoic acid export membrane protein
MDDGSRSESSEAGVKSHGAGLGWRTLEGTFWLFSARIYRQVLFVGRAVVLGRLLTPQDFGLVGVGDLAIMFLGVLTYTGFGEALVQRPHLSPRTLHTVWWVTLGRQALVTAILWGAAPAIAALFQAPAATPILQALALIQLLSGVTVLGVTLLNKEMQFRKLLLLEGLGSTVDLAAAVGVALVWPSAWALVLGAGAGSLTRVALCFALYPYRPRFAFDAREALELFKFGQWLLFGGILYFVLAKGTDMMSGFIYGAAALGLYQMASRFALLPTNHFGEMFSQGLFPAFSLIQDDRARLTAAFLKVLQVVAFFIFPLSALMVVVVGPILPLFLGPKWQGVVALVPGLALGGAVQAWLRTGAPLFMATARPSYLFAMDLASSAGIIFMIYPMSRFFGLEGLAWAYAGGIAWGIPVWWRSVRRQASPSSRELLVSLIPAVLASLVLAGVVWLPCRFFGFNLSQWSSLGPLAALALLGGAAYLAFIILAERIIPDYEPLRASLDLMKRGGRKNLDNDSQPIS